VVAAVVYIVALCAAAHYGGNNRQSYINDMDFGAYLENNSLMVAYSHYPFDAKYDIYGEGNEPESFADLESKSGVVVKASLNIASQRTVYEGCVLSKVNILDVYKGNVKPGESIDIFEPVDCQDRKEMLYFFEGYIPMQPGEEYILYLNPLKGARFSRDKFIYIPSTITYSKYKTDVGSVKIFDESGVAEEKAIHKYKNIKDEEVYLYDSDKYELFVMLKKNTKDNFLY
jgi:hypothetical protein